jgi:predicted ester cyclase
MSTEQNKALLRRLFEEGINQKKPGVIDEVIAPDFAIYDTPMGTLRGPAGFRQLISTFLTGLPDAHVTFEAEFADGDYVIHRGYFTGTHQGEFLGVAPTGKPVKVKTLDIWRVTNGKAVENWVQMDLLGLMQQLGSIPAPERAGR